jgi:hypothetical protein
VAQVLPQWMTPIGLDPTLAPLDLESMLDQTGNGLPELAMLDEGSFAVQVEDASGTQTVNTVTFSDYGLGKDLEIYSDLDGNGSAELAVLRDHLPGWSDKLEIRDAATGEQLSVVEF